MKRLLLFFVSLGISAALSEQNPVQTTKTLTFSNGKKLTVMVGDITKQPVDAIVNAANQQLAYGSGVAGAIYSAARPQSNLLQQTTHAINPVISGDIRCPVGAACPAIAFGGLRTSGIKYVIEAVGPVCATKDNPTRAERDLVDRAYRSVVDLAVEIGNNRSSNTAVQRMLDELDRLERRGNVSPASRTISTIAVPLISADIFGFGRKNSIEHGIRQLKKALQALPSDADLSEVRLMIYVPGDAQETKSLFDFALSQLA